MARSDSNPVATVLLHPCAAGLPVTQQRTRGRLPKSVASLSQARRAQRSAEVRRIDMAHAELKRYASDCINDMDLAPNELHIVGHALAIVERKLRSGGQVFDTSSAVTCFLQLHMGALPHEEFGVLFLDAQNRLIQFERLFRGTLTQTYVHGREVVLRALAHRAKAVILAHNHPSGVATPSDADKALTYSLKSCLSLVDVHVLDHIIVTANGCASMAELGMV